MELNDPAATPKHRALVVDDDALQRRMFGDALSARGFSVVEADGAEAALGILAERGPVDLVITDLWMPNAHGEQLVKALRAREADGASPLVIVVTAEVTSKLELSLQEAGADAVLSKRLGAPLISAAAQMLVSASAPVAARSKSDAAA
ncbi:MAG TPA: response regulator [Anaeromyxobacteraceae bacterium]|nr:response regulator [Anaeromyxobacteraceae bacterium]